MSPPTKTLCQHHDVAHRRHSPEKSNNDTRKQTGTVDPAIEAALQAKVSALIAGRGAQLEALLQARDPGQSGKISVKAFSECLRAWDSDGGVGGRSVSEGGGGGDVSHSGGKFRGEKVGKVGSLTHADRKVLYKRWAVKGQVNYPDFLRAGGHHETPSTRHSGMSAAATRARLHSFKKTGPRPSLGARGSAAGVNSGEDEEEEELLSRARVVLVHLSEVGSVGHFRGMGES